MPFCARSSRCRSGRESRMGTSLIVSAPPTSTALARPASIAAAACAAAWLDEMHACVTVCAGTVSGMPADSAASRAMLDVRTAWGMEGGVRAA
jgi:hypothetical protein